VWQQFICGGGRRFEGCHQYGGLTAEPTFRPLQDCCGILRAANESPQNPTVPEAVRDVLSISLRDQVNRIRAHAFVRDVPECHPKAGVPTHQRKRHIQAFCRKTDRPGAHFDPIPSTAALTDRVAAHYLEAIRLTATSIG
jgi:hypothetical protein